LDYLLIYICTWRRCLWCERSSKAYTFLS